MRRPVIFQDVRIEGKAERVDGAELMHVKGGHPLVASSS